MRGQGPQAVGKLLKVPGGPRRPRLSAKQLAKAKADGYDINAVLSHSDLHVNMSNALNSAAHGLSLAEKRLLMMAISTFDSYKRHDWTKPAKARVMAMDFAESWKLDPSTAYVQLEGAAKHLYQRSVVFATPVPGTDDVIRDQMRWVTRARYYKGQGWVEVYLSPEILVHIVELKSRFTSYKLERASALRSVYSWRLMELLNQYEKNGEGWMHMDIEPFCHAVEATDSQRANFGKIRSQIIEPAVKELTEKDGWLIEWKASKEGRRVTALRFEFRRNPQSALPFGSGEEA